jgi:hypothetical protein
MGTETKHAKVFLVLLATALLQQACSQNIGPLKIQDDVTKAQAAGEKMVTEAQANLDLVYAQNNSDIVNARLHARAHDPRNASSASTNNAAARRLRAEAAQKIADAQYEVDKARAQARYNVAKAQCDAHATAAPKSCADDATTSYGSAIAAARRGRALAMR